VRIHVSVYVYVYVYMYIPVYVRVHVYMYVNVHMHVYVYVCVYVCVCAYIRETSAPCFVSSSFGSPHFSFDAASTNADRNSSYIPSYNIYTYMYT